MTASRLKRRTACLVVLMLLAGISLLAWNAWPRERLLLQHANRVVNESEGMDICCWLTDHTLLLVVGDPQNNQQNAQYSPSAWTGRADILDTRTHLRLPNPGLTHMLNSLEAEPMNCELAPGGKWLRWTVTHTPDLYPNPIISSLDGSHHYHWNASKGDAWYWLNDHLWIDQDDFMEDDSRYSCLHVLDLSTSGSERDMHIDSAESRSLLSTQATYRTIYAAKGSREEEGPS